ncbi:hypothetical protein EHO58_13535 [Leptospira selangorensis]|uniref:LIC_11904 family protein n=1 Tax=Leptospira selangorensis TaxID=2484982 RepID=UPI00108384CC|nr:hypothetical protein [Leptospira selangorensis]TGK03440.1 hypothetical protein EHO58_13535 [Leptospira selangorensis]
MRIVLPILLIFSIISCNKPKTMDSTYFGGIANIGLNDPEGSKPNIVFSQDLQVNSEILGRAPKLFFGQGASIDLRGIEAVDVAVLEFGKGDPSLTKTQETLVILDSTSGSILYSKGSNSLSYITDSSLKNAKGLALLANGEVYVLTVEKKVSDLFRFTGGILIKNSTPKELFGPFFKIKSGDNKKSLYAFQGDSIFKIALTLDSFVDISSSFEQKFNGITAFDIEGNLSVVSDTSGTRVSYFKKQGNIFKLYSSKLNLVKTLGEVEISHIVSDLEFLKNDFVAISCVSDNYIFIADPDFQLKASYMSLPDVRPFKGVNPILGLALDNTAGSLYIYNYKVLQSLKESSVQKIYASRWQSPEISETLYNSVVGRIFDGSLSLSTDLLSLPEVIDFLNKN